MSRIAAPVADVTMPSEFCPRLEPSKRHAPMRLLVTEDRFLADAGERVDPRDFIQPDNLRGRSALALLGRRHAARDKSEDRRAAFA